MTDPSQPPRFPAWLAAAVVVMMGLQLALTWLQGSLIHRQHQDLLDLREDVQYLADTLEQGVWEEDYQEQGLVSRRERRPLRLQRIQTQPSEEDLATKELQDSRESAQKAVRQAGEVRAKLSIEENIRKAEETAKVAEAGSAWQRWLWAALGAGLVAVGVRSWLRSRG